jgi:hypothetical protein
LLEHDVEARDWCALNFDRQGWGGAPFSARAVMEPCVFVLQELEREQRARSGGT